MSSILIRIFMGLVFLSACKTNEKAEQASSTNAQTELGVSDQHSLLWEISGKDLQKSSFLFGTIHLISAEDYFLPPGTLSAIDACQKMMFEIDMKEMNDMSAMMPLLSKAFMADGKTLKDVLNPEDYSLVKTHFEELGLPLMFLERIKPMFLTVFASGDFNPGDLQSGKVKSYEIEFSRIAEDSNKETGGLESIDYQIGIFDKIPDEDQAIMLVEAIKSSDTEGDQFKEMVSMYKSQNIEAMYQMMKGDATISTYEDELLTTRNKNWIPLMEQLMAEQATFFAVGAGHLGGPNGVVQLLKNQGYTVRPYKS